MGFEFLEGELDALFFCEREDGLEVAIEVSEVLGGVCEVLEGVSDVAECVLEIFLSVRTICFGVGEVGRCVGGFFATGSPIVECVLEVVDEVIEIFERVSAVILRVLEVCNGVGEVVFGVAVIKNRVFDFRGGFWVGFEEGREFGFHECRCLFDFAEY